MRCIGSGHESQCSPAEPQVHDLNGIASYPSSAPIEALTRKRNPKKGKKGKFSSLLIQNINCRRRGRYVRLELLEGVAAWYAGDQNLARERLLAARAKWAQLQVSDDALASLGNMGFRTAEVSLCYIRHRRTAR